MHPRFGMLVLAFFASTAQGAGHLAMVFVGGLGPGPEGQ